MCHQEQNKLCTADEIGRCALITDTKTLKGDLKCVETSQPMISIAHIFILPLFPSFLLSQTGSDFNYSTETEQNAVSKDLIVYFDVFPAVPGAVSPQLALCFHIYQNENGGCACGAPVVSTMYTHGGIKAARSYSKF